MNSKFYRSSSSRVLFASSLPEWTQYWSWSYQEHRCQFHQESTNGLPCPGKANAPLVTCRRVTNSLIDVAAELHISGRDPQCRTFLCTILGQHSTRPLLHFLQCRSRRYPLDHVLLSIHSYQLVLKLLLWDHCRQLLRHIPSKIPGRTIICETNQALLTKINADLIPDSDYP